ncbi:lysostaphin resistance A-like protein [Thermodesulfobacteriota bacterium]
MVVKYDLLLALGAYLAVLAISFYAAIGCGYGEAESAHLADSAWMYVRRLLLLGCAAVLPLATGSRGLFGYGWRISLRWAVIAAIIGVATGFVNPGGFDLRHVSALLLACFHALAMELFFRAYLITTLSGTFRTFWPPVIISALLYGIFYLSVWTIWQRPPGENVFFVCLFTCIGLVYGYCYKKSGSFLVPWLAHFLGVLQYKLLLP